MMKDHENLCRECLLKMIQFLGFSADVEVQSEERSLVAHIKTEETARLIGRRGRHLENLEMLLNRLLKQQDAEFPPVAIDIDGYRRKKRGRGANSEDQPDEEEIKQLASETAEEVRRWGESRTLGPYKSGARRIIHQALNQDPEVTTSSGEESSSGDGKYVEIRLQSEQDVSEEPYEN